MTQERSDIKRLAADPMFKLEHDTKDKGKMAKVMPSLRELEQVQTQWKDDFAANSLMRGELRVIHKVHKVRAIQNYVTFFNFFLFFC